eukprot:scaffold534329_cov15-Prasinocladus_malaysianus.AAC.1
MARIPSKKYSAKINSPRHNNLEALTNTDFNPRKGTQMKGVCLGSCKQAVIAAPAPFRGCGSSNQSAIIFSFLCGPHHVV